jgi:hypothetical protein
VVEGNRRLTALKLLADRELAQDVGGIEWARLFDDLEEPLTAAFVVVHASRDEVTSFLGFRHITGILKWEPDAKARWIASLVDKGSRGFAEVAREIGSTSPTVRDNYVAHNIVRQAAADGIDTDAVEEDFSVLYRALSTPGIRTYIGVDLSRTPKQLLKPVPPSKLAELRQLLSWMFGDEDEGPALKDSRQLDELGEVLADDKATKALTVSRDVSYAFEIAGGEERRVIDNLDQASFHLDEALSQVHRHKRSKAVASAVQRCAETMIEISESFPRLKLEMVGADA